MLKSIGIWPYCYFGVCPDLFLMISAGYLPLELTLACLLLLFHAKRGMKVLSMVIPKLNSRILILRPVGFCVISSV